MSRHGNRAGRIHRSCSHVLHHLQIQISRHHFQSAAIACLDQHVGEDGNGVAPLNHGLHVGEAAKQRCAFNRGFHESYSALFVPFLCQIVQIRAKNA